MIPKPIICEQCNNEFYPQRQNVKYCWRCTGRQFKNNEGKYGKIKSKL